MANLHAELSSNTSKGKSTKTGSSWIMAHIKSWDVGVEVQVTDLGGGQLEVVLWKTGGTNSPRRTMDMHRFNLSE